ncbi:MAG: hypothetical protein JST61_09220 [Acidobacteria bacterium]|nr:hypothetical protein [Acidobacteriota bacterium]
MMRVAFEELRQLFRETPGAAAALLIAVVLGIGVHAALFYEADGEDLRLAANHSVANVASEVEAADPFTRMRARIHCPDKVPGFTLIVGLREYNVELSVPVADFASLFERTRPEAATAMLPMKGSTAA